MNVWIYWMKPEYIEWMFEYIEWNLNILNECPKPEYIDWNLNILNESWIHGMDVWIYGIKP